MRSRATTENFARLKRLAQVASQAPVIFAMDCDSRQAIHMQIYDVLQLLNKY